MSTGQNQNLAAPSFILSHARAGSTLLRYIIDTHPEICSPGELYLGRLCSLFMQTADMTYGAVSGASDPAERHRLTCQKVRQVTDDFMGAYARGKGKRLWCEKTPKNVDFLHALVSVYPEAKYICLYRHCMDVVDSCLEAARRGLTADLAFYARNENNHVAVFVDSWVEKTTKLLALERQPAVSTKRVKYESLVLNPSETLGPLFEFLGVGWDEGLVERVFTTPHDMGRAPGDEKAARSKEIHRNSLGRGVAVNWQMIPPHLLEKMNELLRELGYTQVGPNWEQALSFEQAEAAPRPARRMVSQPAEVFTSFFPELLKRRGVELQELSATCKFVVTGEDGGTWELDLSGPGARASAGAGQPACTITTSASDLLDVVNGVLNAAEALRQGRLRVSGDMAVVEKMGQILLS